MLEALKNADWTSFDPVTRQSAQRCIAALAAFVNEQPFEQVHATALTQDFPAVYDAALAELIAGVREAVKLQAWAPARS